MLVSSHLMSELQDTADHLVVIGRGQVIADTSVAALIEAASGDRVELRTAARTEAMTVLAHAGATVAATAPDALTISGLPAEKIVAALTDSHIPFTEVAAHRATLEEAYMELTRDAVEFHAGGRAEMTVITPATDRTGRPAATGSRQLLHAEWTKFRTVRGWVIGAIVAVVVTAGIGLLSSGGSSSCVPAGRQERPGPQRGSLRAGLPAWGRTASRSATASTSCTSRWAANGTITARVTSLTGLVPAGNLNTPMPSTQPGLQEWAKAGIIIKASANRGIGVRGDDGRRRSRGAHAVELHRGYRGPARHRRPGGSALAAADPVR